MYDNIEADKQWYDKNSDKLETIYRNIRFLIKEVGQVNDELTAMKEKSKEAFSAIKTSQDQKFKEVFTKVEYFEKRIKFLYGKSNTIDEINAGTELIGNNFNLLRHHDIEIFRHDKLVVDILNKLDEASLEKLQVVWEMFEESKITDKKVLIAKIVKRLDSFSDKLLNRIFEELAGERWKYKGAGLDS